MCSFAVCFCFLVLLLVNKVMAVMFVMSLLIVASGRYVTFLRLSGPVRAAVLFVPPPLFR